MAELSESLPSRVGSEAESSVRTKTYYRLLKASDETDFVEACDRILWQDEWFPPIARLAGMIDQCATDRTQHQRAEALSASPESSGGLVCGVCKGGRWLRTGHHGNITACPSCTYDGKYNPLTESATIRRVGGVVPEGVEPGRVADFTRLLAPFRCADGSFDGESLYRHSRELRGIDPDVDARPTPVAGFLTLGRSS